MARTQAANYDLRREAMLDQAAALFARHGFLRVSMAELAAECAVSKSLLYHYFPSKEDLLYEVMTSHLDQLVEDVDAVVARIGEDREKVSDLIHAFMRHYVGAAARQKVLLNELESLPDEKRALVVTKQRSIIDSVQDLLRRLPTAPQDKSAGRAFTMLVFGMINWTHTWYDPSGPVSPDQLADMVIDLISPGAS